MRQVARTLERAGLRVGVDEFLRRVGEAAARFGPLVDDPRAHLTTAEAATLTAVGADVSPRRDDEPDERAAAAVEAATVVATALTVRDAAARLGVDPSRVRHRLAEGRLTGLRRGGGWRLPAWQFTGDDTLPGLGAVIPAIPDDLPAAVVAAFFLTADPDLEINGRARSPRDWLAAGGDPARVTELAGALGQPA
jgi:excisionase family DNA binding protein